jgi:DUF2911 family protein
MLVTAVVLSAVALGGRAEHPIPLVYPDTLCQVLKPDRVPVSGRKSPLDSLTFMVGKRPVKVCYGRPSSRGRVMLGGEAVPYGKLWRTGANEPTIFFTPLPVTLAGLKLPPGVYSLYTVPDAAEWQVIVNRSISQWGEESNYTAEVQAHEVGRAAVRTEALGAPIERFTIRAEPGPAGAASLVLEWERSRIRIPIKPA